MSDVHEFDTGIELPLVTTGETAKAYNVCIWLKTGPVYIFAGPSKEMAEEIASDIRQALMDAFDIGYAVGQVA